MTNKIIIIEPTKKKMQTELIMNVCGLQRLQKSISFATHVPSSDRFRKHSESIRTNYFVNLFAKF